jgi:hypothetical protein
MERSLLGGVEKTTTFSTLMLWERAVPPHQSG